MILIQTYGKVCSTSLHLMLERQFPGEAFHSHGLTSWTLDPISAFSSTVGADTYNYSNFLDEAPLIQKRIDDAQQNGEVITILTGVRDPISHSLSVIMQNLEIALKDCIRPSAEETARVLADRATDLWLNDPRDDVSSDVFLHWGIRTPFEWLYREIEEPFGFSLQETPIDRETGYSIFENDNFRLMIYRYEDAPFSIEKGLAELFPDIDTSLPYENVGSEKPTADIYQALLECFRLPRQALEKIYAHPGVRHYYDDDEIAAAISRWSEPEEHSPLAENPPTTQLPDQQAGDAANPNGDLLATVFIPLHNHAQWIGEQIDSLLEQWRPDVELLLIDDGSTDGGLDVALERLASRPDVAATVIRNGHPRGHAMVPDIVRYARGEIIIQADSDDITLPGRLDAILNQFALDPDCRMVTSNAVLLTDSGIPCGLYEHSRADTVLSDPTTIPDHWGWPTSLGATSAFHRSVIEAFEPLDPELCPYGMDLLTSPRALMLGTHHYLIRPLVGWRQHAANSHRKAGSRDQRKASRERYGALELMVLAQRVRDVQWLRQKGEGDPQVLMSTLDRCRDHFMTQFDQWSRLSNRDDIHGVRTTSNDEASRDEVSRLPSLPPVFTLIRHGQYGLDRRPDLTQVLSQWPGFDSVEEGFIWTNRQALVVFRVSDPDAEELVLTVAGMDYITPLKTFLSVNFQSPVEFVIDKKPQRIVLPLSRHQQAFGDGLVTVHILTPQAAAPADFNPENSDQRVLGFFISALEVS
ncbi:glycosyltransferase [Amphritea sp.]|uniref:glycosyltransferase n=1 Tax=Amphritea sp. TaxID=1872502 RepID=UPI003D0CE614